MRIFTPIAAIVALALAAPVAQAATVESNYFEGDSADGPSTGIGYVAAAGELRT